MGKIPKNRSIFGKIPLFGKCLMLKHPVFKPFSLKYDSPKTIIKFFSMLLYKSLYYLWGNFCYPLSVFSKLRIKLRFYCQKPDKHWAFRHRKNDLKDCSSRSLKDTKIYTLQDNGCCTIT